MFLSLLKSLSLVFDPDLLFEYEPAYELTKLKCEGLRYLYIGAINVCFYYGFSLLILRAGKCDESVLLNYLFLCI